MDWLSFFVGVLVGFTLAVITTTIDRNAVEKRLREKHGVNNDRS